MPPFRYIDEQKWREAIRHHDWYLRLFDDYKQLLKQAEQSDKETAAKIKEEVYSFFEAHLADNTVALGVAGKNCDSERQPVDTIVIHHTKNPPGITRQRLSAMQLLRLYAAYYTAPYYEKEKDIKGSPVFSGHFQEGKQVFYAYHWLVRMDGSVERLLNDNEVGWHAGNWEVNCKSAAICLDNDFENTVPPEVVISSVVRLIKEHYPQIRKENILGHKEANPKTTCPGNTFLDGWKTKII